MSWPDQGIHDGVPFAQYRACDINQADDLSSATGKSVSKSLIINFLPDPSAWKQSPPKKTTAAMKGGSLFDCLLTTPEEFDSRYTVSRYDEFRTNESKAWRAEMEESGIEVIKADQLALAKAQIAAVMSKPEAARLVNGARKQVAFRHKTGHCFWSKGLIDLLPEDPEVIADLKICEPRALESKRSLQRYILDWGIHIQAGNYCSGYTYAGGEERRRFKLIFVPSSPPFRVAVVELPLAAILFGADLYRRGVNEFAQCLKSDKWPSIWDNEIEIDLPEYAYAEGEQQTGKAEA